MNLICDIDDTLANNYHRQHLLGANPDKKNWDAFLHPDVVKLDTPIPGAQVGLLHLADRAESVIFLTGRNERLREVTTEWINTHIWRYPHPLGTPAIQYQRGYTLDMRPDGEHTKATEFKGRRLAFYKTFAHSGPMIYIDDDVYMWPVADAHGCIVLRAPDCWAHINPRSGILPDETHWRK